MQLVSKDALGSESRREVVSEPCVVRCDGSIDCVDRSDEVDFDIVQYNTLKVLIRDEKTHDGYELNSEVLNYLFQTNISIDLVNGLFKVENDLKRSWYDPNLRFMHLNENTENPENNLDTVFCIF